MNEITIGGKCVICKATWCQSLTCSTCQGVERWMKV